jgi:CBS-domain-containing membrane protein
MAQTLSLMKKKRIRRVPVLDKKGTLMGIVSLFDILEKFFIQAQTQNETYRGLGHAHSPNPPKLMRLPVSNSLSQDFLVVSETTPLPHLARKISSKKFFLVASKQGRLLGVITLRDLLQQATKKGEPHNIQFGDLPELDEIDNARLQRTVHAFYARQAKRFSDQPRLCLHFKQHHKKGMRTKHSLHARFSSNKTRLRAEAWDWNLLTAVQKTLKTLEREISRYQQKKGKNRNKKTRK